MYRNYSIRNGTAIATFVGDRYPNKETGNHVADFLHHTDHGIMVLEQIKGHIQRREIAGPEGSGYFNDPRAYSVIMKWRYAPGELRLSTGEKLPVIK